MTSPQLQQNFGNVEVQPRKRLAVDIPGAVDASGLYISGPTIDARSTLPDGTEINDVNGLQAYLIAKRIDQVAFSVLKHLATYATGRSLSYNELVFLREEGIKLGRDGYRMQDMLRFVIHSDLFLKK